MGGTALFFCVGLTYYKNMAISSTPSEMTTLSLRISANIKQQIEKAARREKTSTSEWLRDAIMLKLVEGSCNPLPTTKTHARNRKRA